MQGIIDFSNKRRKHIRILQDLKKKSKIHKNTAQKASFVTLALVTKIYLMVKVRFFQKNQFGIGLWWGKLREIGKKWILEPKIYFM